REIAQAAGVTAVLVNRYFGSKEELFAAAVETAFAGRANFFEGDSSLLAQRLTADVVTKCEKDAERINVFFLLLRSAPNPRPVLIRRFEEAMGRSAINAACSVRVGRIATNR